MAESDSLVTSTSSNFPVIKKTSIQRSFQKVEGALTLTECEDRVKSFFVNQHRPMSSWDDMGFISRINYERNTFLVCALVPSDHYSICGGWCCYSNPQLIESLHINAIETTTERIYHHHEERLRALFI